MIFDNRSNYMLKYEKAKAKLIEFSSERKTSHSAEQMFCSQISIFILGFRGSYPQSMAANSPSSLLLWITFLDFLLSPCQAPPPLL